MTLAGALAVCFVVSTLVDLALLPSTNGNVMMLCLIVRLVGCAIAGAAIAHDIRGALI